MPPTILVATWDNGLFRVVDNEVHRELPDRVIRNLAPDAHGGVLAVVDGHSVHRRSAEGAWREVASSESALSFCVAVGGVVFVGTDDARILRIESDGTQRWMTGFDHVEGRTRWYRGTAIVDGKLMGPPLGVRSMAATCDGTALLVNVHVGGIPRSTDGGCTWQPTIDIDCDVHQVRAHPTRAEIVMAAAAVGLCVSRDAGATWSIEQRGLHATHCSGIAFGANDVFVSAATDPFATRGAVYRRPIDDDGPLQRLGDGLPEWLAGAPDTGCIATRDSFVAAIDGAGSLYVSHDEGTRWSRLAEHLGSASAVHIC